MIVSDSDLAKHANGILTIDLGAIRSNWNLVTKMLPHGCHSSAVIKADGYGLGASKLLPLLKDAGCRIFFLATLAEAEEILPLSEGVALYVLNGPDPGTEHCFISAKIRPVLNSVEQVENWVKTCRAGNCTLPAALHIDTGMNRLGVTLSEAKKISEYADWSPCMVMSHLACADEVDHYLNLEQARRFAEARRFFPDIPGSLAASSGIFLGKEWHHDLVRPGAALWGINPVPYRDNPTQNVVRLEGKIIQLREIDAGETVGYGAHIVSRPTRLAVVAAGYADGLLRSLENGKLGNVLGKDLDLVGMVSMDITIYDVTDMPANELHPGDFIEIIGPGFTIDQVGMSAGTTAYEIMTSLGKRYQRRYVDDDQSREKIPPTPLFQRGEFAAT